MNTNPMNFEDDQAILDLIAAYEASLEQGSEVFFEEKIYLQLIEYYEHEDQPERALQATEYAIRNHSYSSDFYLKKAQLLIDNEQNTQAISILEQANLIFPGEPEIGLLKAEALANMGLHEEALALLNEMKTDASAMTTSNILVCESVIYEIMEEYERTFYALKAALLEHPKNTDALERIWFAVEIAKKYKESIELHQYILEEDPYSHLAWYNLGHSHAYLGNYSEAIEAYEFAFVINEKFEFAYRDCAEICFEIKQYQKALNCYLEIAEHFEPDSELFLSIGQCYQHLENYKTARNYYHRALDLDSMSDEVLFHLGCCYAAEGKWKSAIRAYIQAIRIEKEREEYYAALGEAYTEIGEQVKAETNFKKAIDVAPDQSQYWLQYTSFLIEADRVEEALEVLQEANDYAEGTELLYCRIACLFAINRRQEALYWLGEALEEDFDMHHLLFEVMPDLKQDADVAKLIITYSA